MEKPEDQKCYIFVPPKQDARPTKRRRIAPASQEARSQEWDLREAVYHELWSAQEQRIQNVIEQSDATTIDKIVQFVSDAAIEHAKGVASKIPTGLVITGPNIASHATLFSRISSNISQRTSSRLVVLQSGESPNLKTLLKILIKKATSARPEDDDEIVQKSAGPKLLDYDLELLSRCLSKEPDVDQVIVVLQDTEGFEVNLISEMIDLLSSWLDRIKFTFLFGIATSADRLQERLPGNTLRLLRGQQFDVTQTAQVLESIFHVTTAGEDIKLRLGPLLSKRLLERQKDYNQSVEAFCDALKYAYMAHFYANMLSVLLHPSLDRVHFSSEIFEAIRNLPSFRRLVENLLDKGNATVAQKLIESDDVLYESVKASLQETPATISKMVVASEVVHILRTRLSKQPSSKSFLYVQAISGELTRSPIAREALLLVKKAPSDLLVQLIQDLKNVPDLSSILPLEDYEKRLAALVATSTDSKQPLRSEFDVRNDTLRTTVIAQRVELSKHKAKLSKEDTAYTSLIGVIHSGLKKYLDNTLVPVQNLFLHEVFLYDLRSPHVDVFMAKPRFALERALSAPHDYLDCSCCAPKFNENGHESTLAPTQPPTAILYQLYLESGSLINVSDLWSAFHSILADEESQDVEKEEERTMALFQRALAELTYLGMVKPSRKKTDHIAKNIWKGL